MGFPWGFRGLSVCFPWVFSVGVPWVFRGVSVGIFCGFSVGFPWLGNDSYMINYLSKLVRVCLRFSFANNNYILTNNRMKKVIDGRYIIYQSLK